MPANPADSAQVLGNRNANKSVEETDESKWAEITAAIVRLVNHPIWATNVSQSEKTQAVKEALSKNQGADVAFTAVSLTNGYCVGADELKEGVLQD